MSSLFICEFCDKEFYNQKGYDSHVEFKHLSSSPTTITTTPNEGKSRPSSNITPRNGSPTSTSRSGSPSSTSRGGSPNTRRVERCGYCSYETSTKREVIVHIKRQHTDEYQKEILTQPRPKPQTPKPVLPEAFLKKFETPKRQIQGPSWADEMEESNDEDDNVNKDEGEIDTSNIDSESTQKQEVELVEQAHQVEMKEGDDQNLDPVIEIENPSMSEADNVDEEEKPTSNSPQISSLNSQSMPISIPTTTGPATSRPQRPILYPLNSGSPRSPPQFSSIPSHPSIRPQMRPPPPTTSSSNQTQTTQTTQTQNQARPKVRPKLDKPIQVIPTKVQEE